MSRAQNKASSNAVAGSGNEIAGARSDAGTRLQKAHADVMAAIDRAAARDTRTANTTKLAKRGYRPD